MARESCMLKVVLQWPDSHPSQLLISQLLLRCQHGGGLTEVSINTYVSHLILNKIKVFFSKKNILVCLKFSSNSHFFQVLVVHMIYNFSITQFYSPFPPSLTFLDHHRHLTISLLSEIKLRILVPISFICALISKVITYKNL